MMRTVALLSAVAALVALGLIIGLAQARGPSCHIGGAGAFTTPDNACTPGAVAHLSHAEVCAPKDRPALPVAQRRKLVAQYGVPGWTGRDGELDHRVPVFLGGLTVEDNLWPERGAIPNRKDALESLVRRRVCVERTMRVRTAVRLFLSDWRWAYDDLVLPTLRGTDGVPVH